MDETRPNINLTQPSSTETVKSKPHRPRPTLPWLLIIVAVLGVTSVLSLGMYLLFQGSTVILPGVHVGGMPVGGMTQTHVISELDRVWNQEYTLTVIDSSDMQRRWVASPSEFGLSVDVIETAQSAVSIGRGGTLLQNVAEIWMALFGGIEINPSVEFDPGQALAGMQSWADEVDIPPIDAEILFRVLGPEKQCQQN